MIAKQNLLPAYAAHSQDISILIAAAVQLFSFAINTQT